MVAKFDIRARWLRLGCVGVFAAMVLLVGIGAFYSWTANQDELRYPNAELVASHNTRQLYPPRFREDRTFLSKDPFPDVYGWYSIGFDLGPEEEAIGRCISMSGEDQQQFAEYQYNVTLCNTSKGQLIYVTRYSTPSLP